MECLMVMLMCVFGTVNCVEPNWVDMNSLPVVVEPNLAGSYCLGGFDMYAGERFDKSFLACDLNQHPVILTVIEAPNDVMVIVDSNVPYQIDLTIGYTPHSEGVYWFGVRLVDEPPEGIPPKGRVCSWYLNVRDNDAPFLVAPSD